MPEYLTISVVADLLKLSERTVYAVLREGRIPGSAKVAGKWRVERIRLIRWMAAGGELAEGTGQLHG